MKISKEKDKIIIESENDFDIKEILECGQVFSFVEDLPNHFIVVSGDRFANILVDGNITTILTDDPDYFSYYFDLNTDYEDIKKKIALCYDDFDKFLTVGKSIRILKQDPYQTILSFIVSANNNIKRIKKILKSICEKFGNKLECGLYSFPTLNELSIAKEEDFKSLGAGYRSPYLVESVKMLKEEDFSISNLENLTTKDLRKKLLTLKGVGPKVADCILFFGFSRTDVFPVDTWIRKAYYLFCDEKRNDEQIRDYFVSIFKGYSGYAQQYIFNYMIMQ